MSVAATELLARAVVRRDGRLLVVRQRTRSWFFLPGGHVEPGERVEAALVRELGEELGIEAEVASFLGVVEHGYVEDGVTRHELNLVFEVTTTDTEPVSQEEHLVSHWLPLEQLADVDLRPRVLRDALVTTGEDRTPFWRSGGG